MYIYTSMYMYIYIYTYNTFYTWFSSNVGLNKSSMIKTKHQNQDVLRNEQGSAQ